MNPNHHGQTFGFLAGRGGRGLVDGFFARFRVSRRIYIQEQAILAATWSGLRALTAELVCLERRRELPKSLWRHPAQSSHRRLGIWDAEIFVDAIDGHPEHGPAFGNRKRFRK